ncbi:MAG: patatin-like phospholipase family protein [Candidatus Coatesbacteria bacterium]
MEETSALRPGIGVAFGGGVVYSIAGVGVALGLREAGLPVVAVSGTSGGALVGAAVAAVLRPAELRAVGTKMDWGDLVRFTPGKMGLLNGEPIRAFVERITGCRTFEELRMPFTAVATDILRGAEVRFTTGPLGMAVQASCAIPGLFQPVRSADMLLVDGGISANLPADAVRAWRPAVTLAVDVLTLSDQYQGPLRTGAQVVIKAYHTMVKREIELQERNADFVVMPNVSGLSVLNFRDAPEIIARGEEAIRPLIARIRALLADRTAGSDVLPWSI